jgi:hypothetical protein
VFWYILLCFFNNLSAEKKDTVASSTAEVAASSQAEPPSPSQMAAAVSVASDSGAVDVEKRVKAVQKKLKQIAELKNRRAAGGSLDEGQVRQTSVSQTTT